MHGDGEARMLILILKILGMWSTAAIVGGLALGALISRGEQVRKDEYLTTVFASLEILQSSRS
jgi:hypothetical protein